MTLPVGNLGTRFGEGKMAFETTRLFQARRTRSRPNLPETGPSPARSLPEGGRDEDRPSQRSRSAQVRADGPAVPVYA
jgi:hypothetical protein